MASVQGLGKCRVSRGASCTILCLECCLKCLLKLLEPSKDMHHSRTTNPLFCLIAGVLAFSIKHSVFSVMVGLIVGMLVVLFSIYNNM